MTMPYYASPEQLMRDRSEYARKGISRGRSVAVVTYADGVLFIAENPSSTLHKVGELYDRIGFAAVGRYSEFESLRVAGVRLADVRGYSYNRRDVTGRVIANAYAQTLGAIFTEQTKPYEVELCVAEVGDRPENDQLYRLTFDGSIVDEPDFVVMGGQAEAVTGHLREHFHAGHGPLRRPAGRRPRAVRGQPGHRRLRQRRPVAAHRRAARGRRPRPAPSQAGLPPRSPAPPCAPCSATRTTPATSPRTRPGPARTPPSVPEPGTPPGLGDPANPDTARRGRGDVRGLTGRQVTDYRVNKDAVAQARKLIDAGKYDDDTEWSDAAPSADDENAEIEKHGYEAFGAWHLAIDPDASEETKGRYTFPYGDFSKVNRAGAHRTPSSAPPRTTTTRSRRPPTNCSSASTRSATR